MPDKQDHAGETPARRADGTSTAQQQAGETSAAQDQASPAKCILCDRPMSTPVVCDFCHSLNPASAVTDYFTLLGLPRQFEVDPKQLRQRFFALSRHAHPDQHSLETPEVQEMALRLSSTINDAYRTLSDPARRGAYLLELLGGKSSAQDKSVPDGFLGTMMMMQEEIAEAKAAGDSATTGRLHAVLVTQHEGLSARISELFRQYQESVGCEGIRQNSLVEIRRQLNAISYVQKLLSQLDDKGPV
jgi:molecular chaperone HscB